MTPRIRYRDAVGGFTLVEALVAMVLMGLVLGALATVTSQWLPNWNRGFSRVQRAELLEVAVERMVADISAAEFVPANRQAKGPLFDGSELGVTFVRAAVGPNTRSGLEIVRIGETAERQGPVVVRMRAPFAPSAAGDQPLFADPVVLLRAPYRLSLSYAGRDGVWKSQWRDADRLPAAVRLGLRDAASDRVLPVSTVATIRTELPADCVGPKGGDVCGGPGKPGTKTDPADAAARRPQ
jgi:general secretion pathway protein J